MRQERHSTVGSPVSTLIARSPLESAKGLLAIACLGISPAVGLKLPRRRVRQPIFTNERDRPL
jgi:hypothetical protein